MGVERPLGHRVAGDEHELAVLLAQPSLVLGARSTSSTPVSAKCTHGISGDVREPHLEQLRGRCGVHADAVDHARDDVSRRRPSRRSGHGRSRARRRVTCTRQGAVSCRAARRGRPVPSRRRARTRRPASACRTAGSAPGRRGPEVVELGRRLRRSRSPRRRSWRRDLGEARARPAWSGIRAARRRRSGSRPAVVGGGGVAAAWSRIVGSVSFSRGRRSSTGGATTGLPSTRTDGARSSTPPGACSARTDGAVDLDHRLRLQTRLARRTPPVRGRHGRAARGTRRCRARAPHAPSRPASRARRCGAKLRREDPQRVTSYARVALRVRAGGVPAVPPHFAASRRPLRRPFHGGRPDSSGGVTPRRRRPPEYRPLAVRIRWASWCVAQRRLAAMTTCAACGQQNPDGARFCNACGQATRRALPRHARSARSSPSSSPTSSASTEPGGAARPGRRPRPPRPLPHPAPTRARAVRRHRREVHRRRRGGASSGARSPTTTTRSAPCAPRSRSRRRSPSSTTRPRRSRSRCGSASTPARRSSPSTPARSSARAWSPGT